MMQPHERRLSLAMHSALRDADRQPTVIIRVPLLLVPFSGLQACLWMYRRVCFRRVLTGRPRLFGF